MSSEIAMHIRNRIIFLRKRCGYTQEKLAELSGIEYKHIQKLESKNPSNPRIDTLLKLAQGFQLTLIEFLDFDYIPPIED